ncbi:MAG: excinuclease ABC subunit UvrA [Bacteroidota bacterium]|nr:excinuclease ABC subunit UvrA [Bacteroidota bacterium]
MSDIIIRNASENNLKSVSLVLPKNELIVVTGVSGSGKSSLVFDVIYREAENRFFGSFSSQARQFLGKLKRPDVESIEGLSAAIAVDQRSVVRNSRSTVGTITGIYDHLRLLFARTGIPDDSALQPLIRRSLFSFNTPEGACPECKGIGVQDCIDPALFIADENKTLREGALILSTPNGYIIYSQVTIDVLDQVLKSEGFSVDIPWKDLTPEQKHIVLFGSNKIEIPFGKHTLESRMRWNGITAKPREMGFYKGIIPVMETILKRERNKNILRFVRSVECPACHGSRLNEKALSVRISGKNIADLATMQLDELRDFLEKTDFPSSRKTIAQPIIEQISSQIRILEHLGLQYLSLARESTTLSGGESQRLRLAGQVGNGLSGMIYIFDEPSIGLHPRDTGQLLNILESLRDTGNTVIVVEHDDEFIRRADRIVDIGPGPGASGGEILFNESREGLGNLSSEMTAKSRTLAFLRSVEKFEIPAERHPGNGILSVSGAEEHNLKRIDVSFLLEALNVVTGVSGAGKSTLTHDILGKFLQKKLNGSNEEPGKYKAITGWEKISKVITVDQSPIGKTPRSNPATYTGLSDPIRDLFATQALSRERGYDKSRFSFNTEGGRCEACQGAGFRQIGMHFMGNVEVPCETCDGKRFNKETLDVTYRGKNISDIYDLSVDEALSFFADQPKLARYIQSLQDLGLGYLKLGQRSSTLSGGEAQRVKLATELARPQAAHTLYILDEPTTGLHNADVKNLLVALNGLVKHGHTVILIEHHPGLILAADHVTDLGPGSGKYGGTIVFEGTPSELLACENSFTAKALNDYLHPEKMETPAALCHKTSVSKEHPDIRFTGVTTNNLKSVDVSIPHNRITVITGPSGSGKSSLAFDTVFAESHNRFMQSFSTYVRNQLGVKERADFDKVSGLTPALAVDQHQPSANPRSTVGTHTGIYDFLRLLFGRIARNESGEQASSSSFFSFNHQQGACPRCDGLGTITICDPEKLITDPGKSIIDGAMNGTKTGRFYGDPFGQYVATLKAVGEKHGINMSLPWQDLDENAKQRILHGTGEEIYEVTWEYKREERTGEFHFKGPWTGLANLVNNEYERKHADHRGEEILGVMMTVSCPSCKGTRLRREALNYRIEGKSVAEVSSMPVTRLKEFLENMGSHMADPLKRLAWDKLSFEMNRRLDVLIRLGLGYLSLERPISTLSGGEAHRVRLAGQIGSGLTGLTYVLDEPTVGLHPSDTQRLMGVIRMLRDAGNTVVVVEHDPEVIREADRVIDMGPGAGRNGGRILATGTPEEIENNPVSLTGQILSLKPGPEDRKRRTMKEGLEIRNAALHNLKNLDLRIPSGGIIVVTGVSGSGKSTLTFDVIYESYVSGKPTGCYSISGFNRFDKVVNVRPRSFFSGSSGTVATYSGIFDPVRDLFARTEDARRMGFRKSQFSYLDKEGRCEYCQGTGWITVSMDFLSDVRILCEHCNGKRYRPEILQCHHQGKDISEVLKMTVSEANEFFIGNKSITNRLKLLSDAGLGYLETGQSLETLSGGEARRLELATELMKPGKGATLFLFEEPSTGLNYLDVKHLITLFNRLADQGHTLIIIENDPWILQEADRIIRLGPEGGDNGGYLLPEA